MVAFGAADWVRVPGYRSDYPLYGSKRAQLGRPMRPVRISLSELR
jgi:hypothetical protein